MWTLQLGLKNPPHGGKIKWSLIVEEIEGEEGEERREEREEREGEGKKENKTSNSVDLCVKYCMASAC